MNRCPALVTTSRQEVLPPYRFVAGPGAAMDPRVPQKRKTILFLPSLPVPFNSARIEREFLDVPADRNRIACHGGFFDSRTQFSESRETVTGSAALRLMSKIPDSHEILCS